MPVQNLLAALPDVPEQVRAAVDALRYNSVCSVLIGVRGSVPDISWLYVPDPGIGLENRISFPSNYSTRVAPPGCGAILAEITYNEGDDVAGMSDQQVIDHVTGSLAAMGFLKAGDVIFTDVARHRFAYVVYDLGYQANIKVVRDFCQEIGIDLVGRFAQFEYLNMDGCIRSVMDYVGRSK